MLRDRIEKHDRTGVNELHRTNAHGNIRDARDRCRFRRYYFACFSFFPLHFRRCRKAHCVPVRRQSSISSALAATSHMLCILFIMTHFYLYTYCMQQRIENFPLLVGASLMHTVYRSCAVCTVHRSGYVCVWHNSSHSTTNETAEHRSRSPL